jgi:hypothetical protein
MKSLEIPYYAQIFNLVFFPGSSLYDRALKDGIITGIQDSGYELYFRRGLKYKQHKWKEKNLYLNSLIFMAEGRINRFRLGLLPRLLLPLLLNPLVINYCERHRSIPKTLIALKYRALSLRAKIGSILKAKIDNPAGVYDLKIYLKNKISNLLH